ncbi:MAG: dienelactone hydrolase family protein [Balneolaceae bacterium]
MFNIDPENPFKGPHQNQEPAIAGADLSEAEAALVLVHGRGASAQSILMLAEELKEPTLHYIAPQAYRFTWYPHSFLVPLEQNQPGLNSALQAIYDRVADLKGKGFEYNRILLAGFSQGACLVLEFAARHPARYGGVIGLSGGLIGDSVAEGNYSGSLEGTPVFLGCSDIDPHIPVDRVHKTGDVFKHLGAELTKKIYPGMAHTVSRDELENMKQIIRSVTRG